MSASSPTHVPRSTPSTRRTGRPAAGQRVLGVVQVLLVLTALAYGIGGTTAWALGLRAGDGVVTVPVIADLRALDRAQYAVPPAVGDQDPNDLPLWSVAVDVSDELVDLSHAGPGLRLAAPNSDLELSVEQSTLAERALSGGGLLVGGLAVAAGAVLARRVVSSLASGTAFTERNARRLLGVAAAAAVAGLVAPGVTVAASALVLHRTGLSGPDGFFSLPAGPDPSCLLVVGLLFAVAEAFRQAEAAHRANDGLV